MKNGLPIPVLKKIFISFTTSEESEFEQIFRSESEKYFFGSATLVEWLRFALKLTFSCSACLSDNWLYFTYLLCRLRSAIL
jgi:hypothetical protein